MITDAQIQLVNGVIAKIKERLTKEIAGLPAVFFASSLTELSSNLNTHTLTNCLTVLNNISSSYSSANRPQSYYDAIRQSYLLLQYILPIAYYHETPNPYSMGDHLCIANQIQQAENSKCTLSGTHNQIFTDEFHSNLEILSFILTAITNDLLAHLPSTAYLSMPHTTTPVLGTATNSINLILNGPLVNQRQVYSANISIYYEVNSRYMFHNSQPRSSQPTIINNNGNAPTHTPDSQPDQSAGGANDIPTKRL